MSIAGSNRCGSLNGFTHADEGTAGDGNALHVNDTLADAQGQGCLNAAAILCRCGNDGGTGSLLAGRYLTILVNGSDGGVAAGPQQLLIGGIAGGDGIADVGGFTVDHAGLAGQGNPGDRYVFNAHHEGTVYIGIGNRGGGNDHRTAANDSDLTGLIHSRHVGVGAGPGHVLVGGIFRKHGGNEGFVFAHFHGSLAGHVNLGHGNQGIHRQFVRVDDGEVVIGCSNDSGGTCANSSDYALISDGSNRRVGAGEGQLLVGGGAGFHAPSQVVGSADLHAAVLIGDGDLGDPGIIIISGGYGQHIVGELAAAVVSGSSNQCLTCAACIYHACAGDRCHVGVIGRPSNSLVGGGGGQNSDRGIVTFTGLHGGLCRHGDAFHKHSRSRHELRQAGGHGSFRNETDCAGFRKGRSSAAKRHNDRCQQSQYLDKHVLFHVLFSFLLYQEPAAAKAHRKA